MPNPRVRQRFTGGFGGFLPPPDLPPLGDYEAPTVPQPSITIYPGGGRSADFNSAFTDTPPIDNSNAGYVSPTIDPNHLPRYMPPDPSSTSLASDYRPSPPETYSTGSDPYSVFMNPSDLYLQPGLSPYEPTDTSDTVFMNPPQLTPLGPGLSEYQPTEDYSSSAPSQAIPIPGPSFQPGSERWTSGLSPHPTAGISMNRPGYDIAAFGGNMTLGQFLGTPLALMRFGNDRYQPSPGAASPAPAFDNNPEPFDIPSSYQSPSVSDSAGAIQNFGDLNPVSDEFSLGSDLNASAADLGFGTRPATEPQAEESSNVAPTTAPTRSAPAGGITGGAGRPLDYIGYGPSAMSLADLKIMESQAYGGNPNDMRGTSDEGANIFQRGSVWGRTPGAPSVFTSPASVDAFNRWVVSRSSPTNLYTQATARQKRR